MSTISTDASRVVSDYDVVVVGHGISGLSSAIAARENGAETVILEKSPPDKRGGHTRHAGGIFRFPMEDPEQVKTDLGLERAPEQYTKQDFMDDLRGVSGGRADPELCETLVEESYNAIEWLTNYGVGWHLLDHSDEPGFGSVVGGLQADGEGEGVVESLTPRLSELDVDVRYETEFRGVVTDGSNRVVGAGALDSDGKVAFEAPNIVICAGSYVSNPEKRTRYFGRDGETYVVRGSRFNTGEAIEAAMDIGAMPAGEWGGAHQVMNDANAPRVEGGRARINGYQFGVILNVNGERFLDEGEDFLLKTYAKFGQRVYDQPEQKAFVLFDSSVDNLVVSQIDSAPIEADDLPSLLEKLDVRDIDGAVETIAEFNAATQDGEFDPHDLDGLSTQGLGIEKSNWAVPLDDPPYKCFPVEPAITFAFGGLKIDTESRVQSTRGTVIDGLWAVGNSTTEIFYGNYPGGSALTRGVTFGRRAGAAAAERATEEPDAETILD